MFAGWFQVHDQNEPQQAVQCQKKEKKNKQKLRIKKPMERLYGPLVN